MSRRTFLPFWGRKSFCFKMTFHFKNLLYFILKKFKGWSKTWVFWEQWEFWNFEKNQNLAFHPDLGWFFFPNLKILCEMENLISSQIYASGPVPKESWKHQPSIHSKLSKSRFVFRCWDDLGPSLLTTEPWPPNLCSSLYLCVHVWEILLCTSVRWSEKELPQICPGGDYLIMQDSNGYTAILSVKIPCKCWDKTHKVMKRIYLTVQEMAVPHWKNNHSE